MKHLTDLLINGVINQKRKAIYCSAEKKGKFKQKKARSDREIHIHGNKEKDPVPSNVGTSAALGEILPGKHRNGGYLTSITCLRSLTK